MNPSSILLCTVGTSLFFPNLKGLASQPDRTALDLERQKLATAFERQDWATVAGQLSLLPPAERLSGAEINSVTSLIEHGYVHPDCAVYLLHSDTDDGHAISDVLARWFVQAGHTPVERVCIPDLQDSDPQRFRTLGLRNLTRSICRIVRDHTAEACAINATGGYKAQIAVAVLLGQAIGVPVYYKHERFNEIIAFPPLPVSLDFEVWLRASPVLFALADTAEPVNAAQWEDEWEPSFESLVEREEIDGVDYLVLSATGQIFHETFRERFRGMQEQLLPPAVPAAKKRRPVIKNDEGHLLKYREPLERLMEAITQQIPQVVGCVSNYFNPDLPQRSRFRLTRETIEGIWSDGSVTIRFRVETTAENEAQRSAVCALLNEWLSR